MDLNSYDVMPTHRLLHMAALYVDLEHPLPVDLVLVLNTRGIIFDEETLSCSA